MAFKFITILALITAASAGIIQHHEVPQEHHYQSAPVYHQHAAPLTHVSAPLIHQHQAQHEQYDHDPHPQYNFAYDVQDAVSGDSKSHTESRDGDVVHGEYSLDDADGFRRTVKYTSDSVNGFNAVVHREPLGHHKVVTHTAAVPVQYHHAAPTAIVKSPVSYANLPTHHEHHQDNHHASSYTSYEAPQHHDSHDYYHH